MYSQHVFPLFHVMICTGTHRWRAGHVCGDAVFSRTCITGAVIFMEIFASSSFLLDGSMGVFGVALFVQEAHVLDFIEPHRWMLYSKLA